MTRDLCRDHKQDSKVTTPCSPNNERNLLPIVHLVVTIAHDMMKTWVERDEDAEVDDVDEDVEEEDGELQEVFDDELGYEEATDSSRLEQSTGNGQIRAPDGHFECNQDSFSRNTGLQRDDPGASLLPPFALVRASLYDLDRNGRGGTVLRRDSRRRDHLLNLVLEQHTKLVYMSHMLEGSVLGSMDLVSHVPVDLEHPDVGVEIKLDSPAVTTSGKEKLMAQLECIKHFEILNKKTKELFFDTNFQFPIEVRLNNLTYTVPVPPELSKIRTVYNSSVLYKLIKFFKRLRRGEAFSFKNKLQDRPIKKVILDRINLILKPGRMYLVLGAPGSGKSTLLKAIASRLQVGKKKGKIKGEITYNGIKLKVCDSA